MKAQQMLHDLYPRSPQLPIGALPTHPFSLYRDSDVTQQAYAIASLSRYTELL